jgi:hypothetical protein
MEAAKLNEYVTPGHALAYLANAGQIPLSEGFVAAREPQASGFANYRSGCGEPHSLR